MGFETPLQFTRRQNNGVHSVAFAVEALPVAASLSMDGGAARRTPAWVHLQVPVQALLAGNPPALAGGNTLRVPVCEKAMEGQPIGGVRDIVLRCLFCVDHVSESTIQQDEQHDGWYKYRRPPEPHGSSGDVHKLPPQRCWAREARRGRVDSSDIYTIRSWARIIYSHTTCGRSACWTAALSGAASGDEAASVANTFKRWLLVD
mmetsp:Transcript_42450/g.110054  ORF Transcript_42450/g.110054 Transcript_42450/m.110054 type:complete len:204 (+) Transcript_42450:562-1173(+)